MSRNVRIALVALTLILFGAAYYIHVARRSPPPTEVQQEADSQQHDHSADDRQ